MNQFLEWLAMGGYSMYIWPAYGLVCLVFLMNLLGLKWKKKQTRQELQQWFKR
jgi:heme exporter protein D